MTPFEFLTQGDSPIFAYNPSGNRIMKTYFQDSLRTYTAFHQMPDALNAFGMVMPERSFSNEKYRYGFNGKETDQETQWQDYGFRIYYPNISRFISPDPLIIDAGEYPELSTYQFASNTPIQAIDIDGLEGGRINNEDNKLIGGGGTNNSQSNGSRFTQTNTTGRTRATNTPGKVKTVQANTTKAQVKKKSTKQTCKEVETMKH
jgi:RHS repeat-associated protein